MKFLLTGLVIFAHLAHHSVIYLLLRGETRRRYIVMSTQRTCRWLLRILAIKAETSLPEIRGRLVVCNHLSYTDVLILFARIPSLFVTSVEIKETFLLGQITQLAGCFFVERRAKKRNSETLTQEIQDLRQALQLGYNVIFFPEGTSSNGASVLPFKRTFFQVAIEAQVPIQPLCLRYEAINGESFSPINADHVCWYGDMTFPDHLFNLCRQEEVVASLTPLSLMEPDRDRATLAEEAFRLIHKTYHQGSQAVTG